MSRPLLIAAFLFVLASPAWGVVTFDVVNNSATAGTSISFVGPTVASNSNRALVVLVACANTASGALPTSMTVTWDNGGTNQAMTKFNSINNTSTPTQPSQVSVWQLVAPTTGAKTLASSWTNTNSCYFGVSSWFGVDQTTPLAGFTTATGNDTSATVTQTSAPAGDLTASACTASNGAAAVSSVNQTQMYIDNTNCCTSGGMRDSSGTPAMTCTLSVSSPWTIASVDIQQVAAAGGPPMRTLMGVGQ